MRFKTVCFQTYFACPHKKIRLLAAMTGQLSRFTELGRKVVAVGRNYADHAAELGNKVPSKPLIFMKVCTLLCKAMYNNIV